MKSGPSLNTPRSSHGCERVDDRLIIVAGGRDNDLLVSTEVLEIGDRKWIKGPNLKERVNGNRLVFSNRKDYMVYSIGGNTGHWKYLSKIYGFKRDINEWQLIDNMNEPRAYGSALNVPLNMLPWCWSYDSY